MKRIGYYKGGPQCAGRSIIDEYASKRCFEYDCIVSDDNGGYSALRGLQNAAKLMDGVRLIFSSYSDLGCDEYMRIENELFFMRNGARVTFADGSHGDMRHEALLAACLYFKPAPKDEPRYGLKLPLPENKIGSKRKPPFGYCAKKGFTEPYPVTAPIVRLIFDEYADGSRAPAIAEKVNALIENADFTYMTVHAVLRNPRYLGEQSWKGYHLEPLITLDQWFAAREKDPVKDRETEARESFINEFIFGAQDIKNHREVIDLLIKEAERIAANIASSDNAEALYKDYVLPGLEKANAAEAPAAHELELSERGFKRDMAALQKGNHVEKLQTRAERRADERVMLERRLRRIRFERELFNLSEDKLLRFFARASHLDRLSFEERAYILRSFIKRIAVKGNIAVITAIDPKGPECVKYRIKL